MDATQFYNQLLDEIHADEAELAEKKELARLLRKRFEAITHLAATAEQAASKAVSLVNLKPGAGKTFAAMVEEAIPTFLGREFVVSDVAEAMRAKGFELEEKPNPKITTVLTRLQEAGVLVRTFTGGGNVPNRYRIASDVQDSGPAPLEDLLA